MTKEELEILLTERCEKLDLKRQAFDSIEKILSDTSSHDETDLGGFDINEIKPVFDRFEYQAGRRCFGPVIRTRVGLYVEDAKNISLDGLEPIGYYELETDFDGKILDDYFSIEKEKYVDDINIAAHFQDMNKNLPLEYLKRNDIQYEFVAYVSLIGTLFISKQFKGAGRFIERAYTYLETTNHSNLDPNYLRESKKFLMLVKNYLTKNQLFTEDMR